MLAALILILAAIVLALGFWRAGRARTLPWFANGIVLILAGSAGLALTLAITAMGG